MLRLRHGNRLRSLNCISRHTVWSLRVASRHLHRHLLMSWTTTTKPPLRTRLLRQLVMDWPRTVRLRLHLHVVLLRVPRLTGVMRARPWAY